ncbi:hypothetical protein [Vibrio nigripulchritudo]|uniref:hypothetical protein n=1 Tax=Vibrio nigripulchritudo TaxID=28173 RepID=UPI0005FA7712|nr:hypothetical protein [Vibrio nigripulchritudo]KJY73659.1 hypothetical protein TW74_20190 [Vibrio nigripulchritudo]
MNISTFINYIESAPKGVSDWKTWESSLPNFTSLDPVLEFINEVQWSKDNWKAIRAFIRKGYLEQNLPSESIENNDHVNIFNSKIDNVEIFKSKSLSLSIVRSLESVNLLSESIEALSISHASKLSKITGNIENLKFLSLNKCPKLNIDSIMHSLEDIKILDMSSNKQLLNIEALHGKSSILALYLSDTNVIKHEKTIDTLTSMRNLERVWIKANKRQLDELREALPNIVN